MANTTVVVSGANKGIGRGFVEAFATRPNHTILATVRNPDAADAQSLLTLPTTATGTKVILLKLENTSDTDALDAIKIAEDQGVTTIDTVIANSGTFTPAAYKPMSEVPVTALRDHLEINTLSVLKLFQATFPLLQKSTNAKFIVISSLIGTIGGLDEIPWPNGVYGASKSAVNHITRRIHFENKGIVCFAVHPGAVKTTAGNEACQAFGIPEAFVEVKDSITGMLALIDPATKESPSGQFLSFDGTTIKW